VGPNTIAKAAVNPESQETFQLRSPFEFAGKCSLALIDEIDKLNARLSCEWSLEESGVLKLEISIAFQDYAYSPCDLVHERFLIDILRHWFNVASEVRKNILLGESVVLRVAPSSEASSLTILSGHELSEYYSARLSAGEQIAPWIFTSARVHELRPYQKLGMTWLLDRDFAILADDMGLGKTAQALSAMGQLFGTREIRSALIVVPKTLLGNWVFEARRWLPEIAVRALLPPGKVREKAWKIVWPNVSCVITTYEQLRAPIEALRKYPPDLMICDEAHRLRKPSSKTASGVQTINARRIWALTGTPIERDADDLLGLLSVMAPTRFPCGPVASASAAGLAREHVLRRTKSGVLGELPPVTDVTERLELTSPQAVAYKAALRQVHHVEQSGAELALISKLRSIVDVDPETKRSAKLDRIENIVIRAIHGGEKVVVFSYTLPPLRELERRLAKLLPRGAVLKLEGADSAERRADLVNAFQSNPAAKCLLASTRVAGEGLTLTAASVVIFINEWWNPSSNAQARDRVVRIGQVHPVRSYSFVTIGTIEEDLQRILARKKETYRLILGQDELDRLLARGIRSGWT
jgi:SNF2 family DNA or RNA helicase